MKKSVFNLTNDLVNKDIVRLKTIKSVQMRYLDDDTITIEDALIKEGVVTEEQIYQLVADKMRLELVNLDEIEITNDILDLLPKSMMDEYDCIPIGLEGNTVKVAMTNPLSYKTIYAVNNYTRKKVKTAVCMPSQLTQKLNDLFNEDEQSNILDEAQEFIQSQMTKSEEDVADDEMDLENQPIIKFVNTMISDAVQQRVSDIHLEPQEKNMVIRFRIDGKLTKYMDVTKELSISVTSRIKFISGMNIAEKRIPQDGRLQYGAQNQKVDMRISSLPSVYGEKIVIRITTALGMNLDKRNIGFLPENLEKFNQLLTARRGIILLCGATGSGKSTTLYAALSELNTDDVNIITVENPVEMAMPGITQVNINEKAGLTFASVLRSILRQDPDIIMIGEIRDQETADIAARAAITGHLVLSTIHTYNAASSVARMVDMGVEPYMVSSSMLGVIAQKLVRRLCPNCKQAYYANEEELRAIDMPITEKVRLYKPGQCSECNNIGYKGRIAVHEVMPVSRKIKSAVNLRKSTDEIDKIAKEEGMISLGENLKKLLLDGIISFDTYFDTISEIYQDE